MIDLIQLQDDVYALLMSNPALANVNIVQERKFRVDSQTEVDALWLTPRNGRSGNGILIEEIVGNVTSPNVSGPPIRVELSLVCVQHGDAALDATTGGGFYAANLALQTFDVLHRAVIGGAGTLQARGSAPAREWDFINAYRATFVIEPAKSEQTPFVAPVAVSVAAGLATLTCATAGAVIYYTLDGTTPVDPTLAEPIQQRAVNSGAMRYTVPFAVTAGQTLRCAAYATDYNPSEIRNTLIL